MKQDYASAANTVPPGMCLLCWFVEGLRAALVLPVRRERLQVHALTLPLLLCVLVALQAGVLRSWYSGPADFNPYWLFVGWLPTLALLGGCHALLLRARGRGTVRLDGTAMLFGVAMVQTGIYALVFLLAGAWFVHNPAWATIDVWWGVWAGLLVAQGLALAIFLVRATRQAASAVCVAALVMAVQAAAGLYEETPAWIEVHADVAGEEAERPVLQLTQAVMERQPQLLEERLNALQPQRPGVVDLYALTFAPYAYEDVFRRESAMVADVMRERFDAEGRTLELVNNLDTLEQWPWATLLNLRRTIARVGELMDPDEDVLFIHLTSHGARNGELAADFWPLSVETVTPTLLRIMLNDAGIKNRVISISACYSGSWVEPLADENTLVMTAADAEHTSYGCGRLSELTFFGRAVFDEQLRSETRSFEAAYAAARPIIEQREEEAGKDDGYSNPQIAVGEGVRTALDALVRRLDGDG